MSRQTRVHTFAVGMLAVLALVLMLSPAAATAALIGSTGTFVPTGTNPDTGQEWKLGDTYYLHFITDGTTQATSTDISTYNTFVNAQADLSDVTGVPETTWYAAGSTSTADARDNAFIDAPLYRLDDTLLADGATGANGFYGTSTGDRSDLHTSPTINQYGDASGGGSFWTGTAPDGTVIIGRQLGNTGDVRFGSASGDNGAWLDAWNMSDPSGTRNMHAISEELTVVPEPASSLLLVIAFGGIGFLRRKFRNR